MRTKKFWIGIGFSLLGLENYARGAALLLVMASAERA